MPKTPLASGRKLKMPKLDLKPALTAAMERLKTALQERLQEQGHRLTGSLEKSLRYEVKPAQDGYTAVMTSAEYGIYVEFGVRAARIPYGGRTGRGGKSKYIEGLIRYFQLRGLPQREAQRAAFATANVHRREGMPTRASYRFSRNGERTGFVRSVLTENLDEIAGIIAERAGAQITINLADVIRLAKFTVPV